MSASPNRAEFSGTTDLEVQVTVVSEDEGKPSQQRTQQLRANVKYGSPSKVLCSPFVLGQVAFNALSSVGCSVLLFYFLFVVLVVPPGDPLLVYHWTDPNLVGVVIGSALVVSPTLVMILAPAGMPEAVRNANVARVLNTHWAHLLPSGLSFHRLTLVRVYQCSAGRQGLVLHRSAIRLPAVAATRGAIPRLACSMATWHPASCHAWAHTLDSVHPHPVADCSLLRRRRARAALYVDLDLVRFDLRDHPHGAVHALWLTRFCHGAQL